VAFLGVRGLGVPLTPDFYRDIQPGWREEMLSLGAEYVEPEYVEGLGRDETPFNKQRGIVLMEKALSRLP
jgi:hypothetical protein